MVIHFIIVALIPSIIPSNNNYLINNYDITAICAFWDNLFPVIAVLQLIFKLLLLFWCLIFSRGAKLCHYMPQLVYTYIILLIVLPFIIYYYLFVLFENFKTIIFLDAHKIYSFRGNLPMATTESVHCNIKVWVRSG